MYGTSPLEIMAGQAMLNGQVYAYGFTYSGLWFGATALGATSSQNVTTQITADSDFIIQRLNLIAYSAVGTIQTNPDFTLLLTIAGNAINLMDQAQHVGNICGNFANQNVPSDLPMPILIPANNTLTAQLTNRSAVAQNFVQISYVGMKIKYLVNQDGSPTTRTQVFHVL